MRKGIVFIILLGFNMAFIYGINYTNNIMFNNNFMIYLSDQDEPLDEPSDTSVPPEPVEEINTDFEGESFEKIGKKIDKMLVKTTLEGYGEFIAKTAISKSVNPYLIGGIILESTNCKIECTILFNQCNNVSGRKGDPGCFGGTYKKYSSINDSISDLVGSISNDFYSPEMQAPYKMFKKYGRNETWAFKVTKYMEQLKRTK